MKSKMKKFKLKNGLRVVVRPRKEGNTVGVCVVVNFGSNYEKPEHAGIAHFIEHMLFKGTKKRDKTKINTDIENVGGYLSASTDYESTAMYIHLPKKHLEVGLDVISDIAFNSTFDSKEINKERNVILEEKYLWDTNPAKLIYEIFPATLYKTHPVAKPIIGKVKTIKAINRKDISEVYNKYYVPSNMVLSVVGNVDVDEVRNLIKKYWNKPGKKAPKLKIFKETKKSRKPVSKIIKREVDQVNMLLGFRFANARNKKEWIIGKLIENILSGGMSSRLFRRIRDDLGLVYHVSAGYISYLDYGFFEVYAGAKEKNVQKVKKEILEQFRKLREENVSQKELDVIKTMLEGRFLIQSEQNMQLSNILATHELVTEAETYDKFLSELKKVTPEDIKRVANKYFKSNSYGFAAIVPK